MPPTLLYDLNRVDLDRVAFSIDEIRRCNPQRGPFEQLSYIALHRPEEKIIVGVRDIGHGEFWADGHMPGRPIFPGVLMLEAAAQLGGFYSVKELALKATFGFGGADRVRFRRMVSAGERLILLGLCEVLTPRRSLFSTQGVVGGQLAFEATILGVVLPEA